MCSGTCLTSKLYDKSFKTPSKSQETIPLKACFFQTVIYWQVPKNKIEPMSVYFFFFITKKKHFYPISAEKALTVQYVLPILENL
jgi:hypothetical protein